MNLQQITSLLEYENILNQYSGKRYHVRVELDQSITLVQVKSIGNEKIIVKNLTEEQMVIWLKRHLKVVIRQQVSRKI